jgi:hypothetical protein
MNNILLILIIIISIFIIVFGVKFILYIINFYYPTFIDIQTGCKYERWGCCNDNLTTKLDYQGSNCYPK